MSTIKSRLTHSVLLRCCKYAAIFNSIALLVLTAILCTILDTDSMTNVNVKIVFVSTLLTLCYIFQHSIRERRLSALTPARLSTLRTRTDFICNLLHGPLVGVWLVAASFGLLLSARQPVCKTSNVSDGTWQDASLCPIHRTVVALSVVMLILSLIIFYALEHRTSPVTTKGFSGMTKADSFTSNSTTNSDLPCEYAQQPQSYPCTSRCDDKVEQEQWLQRRNSLSSLKAIYPHDHRVFTPYRKCRTRSRPSQLYSLSETSELSLTQTASESQLSTTWTTTPSNASIRSGSTQFYTTCGNYMDMSAPSSLPERYGLINIARPDFAGNSSAQIGTIQEHRMPSPPPPAWCPSRLKQAPLSSDPAIYALSTGVQTDACTSILKPSQADGKFVNLVQPRSSIRSCTAKTYSIGSTSVPSRRNSSLRASAYSRSFASFDTSSTLGSFPMPRTATMVSMQSWKRPPTRITGHVPPHQGTRQLRRPNSVRSSGFANQDVRNSHQAKMSARVAASGE